MRKHSFYLIFFGFRLWSGLWLTNRIVWQRRLVVLLPTTDLILRWLMASRMMEALSRLLHCCGVTGTWLHKSVNTSASLLRRLRAASRDFSRLFSTFLSHKKATLKVSQETPHNIPHRIKLLNISTVCAAVVEPPASAANSSCSNSVCISHKLIQVPNKRHFSSVNSLNGINIQKKYCELITFTDKFTDQKQ